MTRQQIGQLVEAVWHLPEGRQLLEHIDEYCGMHKQMFRPDSERQTSFNLGKQSVAIHLREAREKYRNPTPKEENDHAT